MLKYFLFHFQRKLLKQRLRRQDSACCRGKNNPYSQDLEVQCNTTIVLFLEQTENLAHFGRFKIILGVFYMNVRKTVKVKSLLQANELLNINSCCF